jgi:hypothetical protein
MARTTTVQQTGKFWKLTKLLGFLGIVAGLVIFFMADNDVSMQRFGGITAGLSLPVWLFGRAGAWWFHG